MFNRIISKIKRHNNSHAIILTYHRIDYADCDPWQLTVTPQNFELQLQILKEKWNVIPLNNLIDDIKNKRVKHRSISITFDDGYLDNFHTAQHLLSKYRLPATFYIPSQPLTQATTYWWDDLESIFLHSIILPNQYPSNIITSSNTHNSYNVTYEDIEAEIDQTIIEKHRSWNWPNPFPTKRAEIYFKTWLLLKSLPQSEREQALKLIKQWSGIKSEIIKPNLRTINLSQAIELSKSDLFTIGGHTSTHPSLPSLSYEDQRTEVESSKHLLEFALNQPISNFSYPFGDFSDASKNIIRKCDYESAVTTRPKTVSNKSDLFELGRFQVNNWNAKKFEFNLEKWIKYN